MSLTAKAGSVEHVIVPPSTQRGSSHVPWRKGRRTVPVQCPWQKGSATSTPMEPHSSSSVATYTLDEDFTMGPVSTKKPEIQASSFYWPSSQLPWWAVYCHEDKYPFEVPQSWPTYSQLCYLMNNFLSCCSLRKRSAHPRQLPISAGQVSVCGHPWALPDMPQLCHSTRAGKWLHVFNPGSVGLIFPPDFTGWLSKAVNFSGNPALSRSERRPRSPVAVDQHCIHAHPISTADMGHKSVPTQPPEQQPVPTLQR